VQLKAADHSDKSAAALKSRDEFYEAAVDIVIREGRGSVSLLQRALGIGYGRAARLIDYMAEDGIVGTYNGSQAREVLITLEQWAEMIGQQPEPEAPRPKRNRILPENLAETGDADDSSDEETDAFDEDEEAEEDVEVGGDEADEEESEDETEEETTDGDEAEIDAAADGEADDALDEDEAEAESNEADEVSNAAADDEEQESLPRIRTFRRQRNGLLRQRE
jgi:DNA segregation ATPase FtsK/SpoIIIE, S-DNA-T family